MNQRDAAIIRRYEESNMYNLNDAYGSYSREKSEAWDRCRVWHYNYRDKADFRGPLKVIGANTFKFSAGFTYSRLGETYFVYITDCGVREIYIGQEDK